MNDVAGEFAMSEYNLNSTPLPPDPDPAGAPDPPPIPFSLRPAPHPYLFLPPDTFIILVEVVPDFTYEAAENTGP